MPDKCKTFIYEVHIKILFCGILIRFNTRVLGFIIIICIRIETRLNNISNFIVSTVVIILLPIYTVNGVFPRDMTVDIFLIKLQLLGTKHKNAIKFNPILERKY